MKVIETKNLSKTYEGVVPVTAVNNITIDFEHNEFTAVVGPSGSGKTTFLNIIGGLDRPTSGEVTVDGVEINNLSDNEIIDFRLNNIGFVFQSYNLIPVLTAKENTEFIMLLQNRPEGERNARVKELLAEVGLVEQANKRPSQMSGGQQQRVAVARALIGNPSLIIADEPTSALDTDTQKNFLDLMFKQIEENKSTLLMVSHDRSLSNYFDRIIDINDILVRED